MATKQKHEEILECLAADGHPGHHHDDDHGHDHVTHGLDDSFVHHVAKDAHSRPAANDEHYKKPKESFVEQCGGKRKHDGHKHKTKSRRWLEDILHSTRGDMRQREAARALLEQIEPDPLNRH